LLALLVSLTSNGAEVISTVDEVKPIKLKFSDFAEAGTDKENLPSAFVCVPSVVPTTLTDTPGSGSPSSLEVTRPVTVLFCACTTLINSMNKHQLASRSFFIVKKSVLVNTQNYNFCNKIKKKMKKV
jgi:hypothetical protein